MNRHVRTFALVVSTLLLGFSGVASGQRAATEADTPLVTWKDAPRSMVRDSGASAGSKVVRDAQTGRLRPARAGELPETAPLVKTQIIDLPGGGGIAVVGDDLMVETFAVKDPDGTVRIGHDPAAAAPAEVK